MAIGHFVGRIALVTGAGSGIGRATCAALSREGASIVAADRDEKNAKLTIQSLKDNAKNISVEVDVKDSSSVQRMFEEVKKHFQKPPSVIVNSAGITRDSFLLKMEESHFDDVINVNLKGTFLVIQTAAKALIDANMSDGASIVNIASIVGVHGNIGQANYSSSKAGVEALTKTAAKELSKFGIRCNAVVPGFIESPMTESVPEKVKLMVQAQIMLGRFGKPEEVAEVISFLASNRSSYINGASIEVTGGCRL
ncbi:estradiol 17-beta-dehydrogenase 8 [Ischnura elegans]|uniref:estradiol 17-beta-dehydrogenase 8 n=1 Tax=Ischnura elegans TaxID=197161 RepID=UPI001ED868C2|nr:estradiol 17-beta-dehydrogenase 8 [Ischnura elegans]